MGFFSKKPNQHDAFMIRNKMQELNYYNETIVRMDNVEGFLNQIIGLKNTVMDMQKYERKYPDVFNPKPSKILKNFETNKLILEKNFIDRYLLAIERKLLNYSTMRGKTNNFNKMVDIFKYYAGEFEPENVNYFSIKLQERFSEFYQ